jgi:hypothetical protein
MVTKTELYEYTTQIALVNGKKEKLITVNLILI